MSSPRKPLESDPLTLERAYDQMLEQVDQLWTWYYRTRLAVLRGRGGKSKEWQDGIHFPSSAWGAMQVLCWLCDELWPLLMDPWKIRDDAEREAHKVFVEEIRNGDVLASG